MQLYKVGMVERDLQVITFSGEAFEESRTGYHC